MGGGTKRGYASEQLNQVGVAPSGPGSQVCTPSSATHATCDASVLCDVTFRIQLVGGCERSRSGGLRGGELSASSLPRHRFSVTTNSSSRRSRRIVNRWGMRSREGWRSNYCGVVSWRE